MRLGVLRPNIYNWVKSFIIPSVWPHVIFHLEAQQSLLWINFDSVNFSIYNHSNAVWCWKISGKDIQIEFSLKKHLSGLYHFTSITPGKTILLCLFFLFYTISWSLWMAMSWYKCTILLLLWYGPCHIFMNVQWKCLDFFHESCTRTAFMGCWICAILYLTAWGAASVYA